MKLFENFVDQSTRHVTITYITMYGVRHEKTVRQKCIVTQKFTRRFNTTTIGLFWAVAEKVRMNAFVTDWHHREEIFTNCLIVMLCPMFLRSSPGHWYWKLPVILSYAGFFMGMANFPSGIKDWYISMSQVFIYKPIMHEDGTYDSFAKF